MNRVLAALFSARYGLILVAAAVGLYLLLGAVT